MNNKANSNVKEMQTDVLIIGGGGSGLPAAAAAIDAGAKKVTIIDKGRKLGGNARMAGGILGVESPVQRRQGIHFTTDEIFKRHMHMSNWNCDARLVRNWLNGTAGTIKWLEDMGLEFGEVMAMSGQTPTYHSCRTPLGITMVKTLIKSCEEKGVDMITETRARKLLTDAIGNVTGVSATQGEDEIRINAKSVVIATGSVSANKELLKRYYPEINFENIKIMAANPSQTGDGLYMAEEVGAARDGVISTQWVGPHNHPHNTYTGLAQRRPYLMYVNKYGERYADESLMMMGDFFWFAGMALDRQPDRMCYTLMDESIKRDMIEKKEIISGGEKLIGRMSEEDHVGRDTVEESITENYLHESPVKWLDHLEDALQTEAEQGRVKIANTLDEIADWMGADPDVLKASVERYNLFCERGYDADFLKEKRWLMPLKEPPYYALIGLQGVDTVVGGIRINHRMEVLNRELRPIGGLYSTGVATSGWLGPGYGFPGSELSFSVYSGHTVGKIVAGK